MMLPVTFQVAGGKPVLINPMYIMTVEELGENQTVLLIGSMAYTVEHSLEDVHAKIKAAHTSYLHYHKLTA